MRSQRQEVCREYFTLRSNYDFLQCKWEVRRATHISPMLLGKQITSMSIRKQKQGCWRNSGCPRVDFCEVSPGLCCGVRKQSVAPKSLPDSGAIPAALCRTQPTVLCVRWMLLKHQEQISALWVDEPLCFLSGRDRGAKPSSVTPSFSPSIKQRVIMQHESNK